MHDRDVLGFILTDLSFLLCRPDFNCEFLLLAESTLYYLVEYPMTWDLLYPLGRQS